MFAEQATIISSSQNPKNIENDPKRPGNKKELLIIGGLILVLIIFGILIWFVVSKYILNRPMINKKEPEISQVNTSTSIFPNLNLPLNATTSVATTSFANIAVEYLSFSDFYKTPDNKIETKFSDYKLPLNVKIDVLNYYDLSRKVNLDPALNDLNTNGFALIDNPWAKEATDFYTIYSNLEQKQIPFLITSDFILYYYHTILKKAYKDIEENIFYDNLWSINKDLYNSAKNRYETRLASIGNINDSILEGERLEAAYFAVALELLKPATDQVAPKGTLDDRNKFVSTETDRFYFVTPPYLHDDVSREVKLIREARENKKSPVMLYNRDYAEFIVPRDYRENARLNNFYLTTKWLNSVFPLNYRDKNCPACLLDKEDWRLGMIASSLIASDFSDSTELKNKWARIYKVMSYFNSLREDINYVNYRDSLKSIFGENYKIDELFNDKNPEAKNNLQKLQIKLNAMEFSPFLGAIDKKDKATNYRLGFKMLVERYSPNDFIFSHLMYPYVDTYLGTSSKANNLTICSYKIKDRRCNSFAPDIINLISPITSSNYFSENTYYLNYESEAKNLRTKLNTDAVWHASNYWSTLTSLSAYLNVNRNALPLYSQTSVWRDRTIVTALGTWVDMQMPMDKFSVNQLSKGQGFNNFSRFNDNSYVEPNLNLINELLANNTMLQKMFTALQINQEVVSVANSLQKANDNLLSLKSVVIKELSGQALGPEDNEIITNFGKQLSIEDSLASQKILYLKMPNLKTGLKEDISGFKLMVLIHQEGEDKVFSVGPVWDYKESR